MTLLFDFGPLSCDCTDHALDALYKSLADPPDDGIWAPHPAPFIRFHLEDVTARGQSILTAIQDDILSHTGGEPIGTLKKADTPWLRWNQHQFDEVRSRLERKDPGDYSLDDWMLLVDWIIQRYLPDDVIHTEAEYLAVRSVLMGRVEANAEHSENDMRRLTEKMPVYLSAALDMFELNPLEVSVIEFAKARAAELITDLGERTRHRIKSLIIRNEELRAIHHPDGTIGKLQSSLLDEFGILNRDWRRIAITEVARNANEGMIAGLPEGTKVRRWEAYPTACPFCKHIHDQVFEVVDPAREDKDGWEHVWVGKTNVGRSSSPRKRVGNELVERQPDELWWPAAGVQHPNCRGRWIVDDVGHDGQLSLSGIDHE